MMRTSTVVLVHGAFLDASGWWPIVLRLLDGGHRAVSYTHLTLPTIYSV